MDEDAEADGPAIPPMRARWYCRSNEAISEEAERQGISKGVLRRGVKMNARPKQEGRESEWVSVCVCDCVTVCLRGGGRASRGYMHQNHSDGDRPTTSCVSLSPAAVDVTAHRCVGFSASKAKLTISLFCRL